EPGEVFYVYDAAQVDLSRPGVSVRQDPATGENIVYDRDNDRIYQLEPGKEIKDRETALTGENATGLVFTLIGGGDIDVTGRDTGKYVPVAGMEGVFVRTVGEAQDFITLRDGSWYRLFVPENVRDTIYLPGVENTGVLVPSLQTLGINDVARIFNVDQFDFSRQSVTVLTRETPSGDTAVIVKDGNTEYQFIPGRAMQETISRADRENYAVLAQAFVGGGDLNTLDDDPKKGFVSIDEARGLFKREVYNEESGTYDALYALRSDDGTWWMLHVPLAMQDAYTQAMQGRGALLPDLRDLAPGEKTALIPVADFDLTRPSVRTHSVQTQDGRAMTVVTDAATGEEYIFDPGREFTDQWPKPVIEDGREIPPAGVAKLVPILIGGGDIDTNGDPNDETRDKTRFVPLVRGDTSGVYVREFIVDGETEREYGKLIGDTMYVTYLSPDIQERYDAAKEGFGVFLTDLRYVNDPADPLVIMSAGELDNDPRLVSSLTRNPDGTFTRSDVYTAPDGRRIPLLLDYGAYYDRMNGIYDSFDIASGGPHVLERMRVIWGGNRDPETLAKNKLVLEDGYVFDNDKMKVSHEGGIVQLKQTLKDGSHVGGTYVVERTADGKYNVLYQIGDSEEMEFDTPLDEGGLDPLWQSRIRQEYDALKQKQGVILSVRDPAELTWVRIENISPADGSVLGYSWQAFGKDSEQAVIKVSEDGLVDIGFRFGDKNAGLRYDLLDPGPPVTLVNISDELTLVLDFFRHSAFVEERDPEDNFLTKKYLLKVTDFSILNDPWEKTLALLSATDIDDISDVTGMQRDGHPIWTLERQENFIYQDAPGGLRKAELEAFEIPSRTETYYPGVKDPGESRISESHLESIDWENKVIIYRSDVKAAGEASKIVRSWSDFKGNVAAQFTYERDAAGREEPVSGIFVYGTDRFGIGEQAVTLVRDEQGGWKPVSVSSRLPDASSRSVLSMVDAHGNVYSDRVFFSEVTELDYKGSLDLDELDLYSSRDLIFSRVVQDPGLMKVAGTDAED
ncbi:MAG: hypothetical protein ACYC5N_11145, partial [Endomicrobiales bacterium]